MFEDILGKDKKYVKTVTWTLHINEDDYEVEVFNAVKNNRGTMEGYIKDSTHVIDNYNNYMISMPNNSLTIKVMMIRVNQYTIKFYVPEGKRRTP